MGNRRRFSTRRGTSFLLFVKRCVDTLIITDGLSERSRHEERNHAMMGVVEVTAD
jgi:hypothetical protein